MRRIKLVWRIRWSTDKITDNGMVLAHSRDKWDWKRRKSELKHWRYSFDREIREQIKDERLEKWLVWKNYTYIPYNLVAFKSLRKEGKPVCI